MTDTVYDSRQTYWLVVLRSLQPLLPHFPKPTSARVSGALLLFIIIFLPLSLVCVLWLGLGFIGWTFIPAFWYNFPQPVAHLPSAFSFHSVCYFILCTQILSAHFPSSSRHQPGRLSLSRATTAYKILSLTLLWASAVAPFRPSLQTEPSFQSTFRVWLGSLRLVLQC